MANVWTKDTKEYRLYEEWSDKSKEAYLYDKNEDGTCTCKLCPRECRITEGKTGFCKVRKNMDGTLYALSYGKATHITIEKIETEAIFHFQPGADILSLGNFGCNLNCKYCQNWKYSQFRYTSPDEIREYTSEEIVEMALKNNIGILSWTYNDPAVWYEFVIDTAKLAKKHGIISLFKSAYYLSEEAVRSIIDVCDIFAVSIKAMDEDYYTEFTTGTLPPVLSAAKMVYNSGKHLEISNLVVTGLTNNDESYRKMISFMKNELSENVPLHFTRFHPDYRYTEVERTPLSDVKRAVEMARKNGLQYVYVGNVFSDDSLNTYCKKCGELLVTRYGLNAIVQGGLKNDGTCVKCGTNNDFVLL